jgi:hypothetical protein
MSKNISASQCAPVRAPARTDAQPHQAPEKRVRRYSVRTALGAALKRMKRERQKGRAMCPTAPLGIRVRSCRFVVCPHNRQGIFCLILSRPVRTGADRTGHQPLRPGIVPYSSLMTQRSHLSTAEALNRHNDFILLRRIFELPARRDKGAWPSAPCDWRSNNAGVRKATQQEKWDKSRTKIGGAGKNFLSTFTEPLPHLYQVPTPLPLVYRTFTNFCAAPFNHLTHSPV